MLARLRGLTMPASWLGSAAALTLGTVDKGVAVRSAAPTNRRLKLHECAGCTWVTLALAAGDIPELSAQLKPQFHVTPDVRIQIFKVMQLCSILHRVFTREISAVLMDCCDNNICALSGS